MEEIYSVPLFHKCPDCKKQDDFLTKLEKSCYICDRIEIYMQQMLYTVIYLWRKEEEFIKKLRGQKYYCLPHYHKLIEYAMNHLTKQELKDFCDIINKTEKPFLAKLFTDVKWFCEKFDYRNTEADWKDSRDAVERAIYILTGEKTET